MGDYKEVVNKPSESKMTLAKIRQRCLKEKAAMMLNVPVKRIAKVEEHPNAQVGARVDMKSGSMPWINIPVEVWIGEKLG